MPLFYQVRYGNKLRPDENSKGHFFQVHCNKGVSRHLRLGRDSEAGGAAGKLCLGRKGGCGAWPEAVLGKLQAG